MVSFQQIIFRTLVEYSDATSPESHFNTICRNRETPQCCWLQSHVFLVWRWKFCSNCEPVLRIPVRLVLCLPHYAASRGAMRPHVLMRGLAYSQIFFFGKELIICGNRGLSRRGNVARDAGIPRNTVYNNKWGFASGRWSLALPVNFL